MSDSRKELRAQLAQRSEQLQAIAAQLKTELFGIDTIIDRVIDSVRLVCAARAGLAARPRLPVGA